MMPQIIRIEAEHAEYPCKDGIMCIHRLLGLDNMGGLWYLNDNLSGSEWVFICHSPKDYPSSPWPASFTPPAPKEPAKVDNSPAVEAKYEFNAARNVDLPHIGGGDAKR